MNSSVCRVTEAWIDFFFTRQMRLPPIMHEQESFIEPMMKFSPLAEPLIENGAWG